MMKKLLLIGTLVLTTGLLAGCDGAAATETALADEVPVVTQEANDAVVTEVIVAEAVIEPARWSDLRFDTSGEVAEVLVQEGDTVVAGDPLVRLETADLERAVTQAEISLREAELQLEALLGPPDRDDVERAQDAVDQAASSLKLAQIGYNAAQDSVLANETLEDAQNAYGGALEDYNYWLNKYNEGEADYWFVEDALETLEDRELELKRVQEQVDQLLQAADNDLERAANTYRQAQNDLEALLDGADEADIEVAQLDVEAAELSLESARDNLEETTLVAPFDGVVAAVNVEAGDAVTLGEVVLVLATLDRLQARTTDLIELDVVRVVEGQPSTVVVDALPGQKFAGVVREVALQPGDNRDDVVYAVIVELIEPDLATELRWGMTAIVEIKTTP